MERGGFIFMKVFHVITLLNAVFPKFPYSPDLNNLTDLSMHREAATLLGYTQEELEENFKEYIDALAVELSTDREDVLVQLKRWYNGYRFDEDSPRVYFIAWFTQT
jgi:hypothetical protein